ncbi:MAG: hypothetical protein ICV77_16005 [Cyanobacteria bacterium Co-bin8]|nr:hypothetical protein [Cyanobacteria bacterium Co-bin8]
MTPFALNQIKAERLILALLATFLMVDNIPHPGLGPSLIEVSLQQVRGLTD